MVWQNDFDLVKDTVDKSPHSRDMRVVYGSMLAERGEYDQALTELQHGSAISLIGAYDERLDLNRAFIAYRQGRIDEAIDIYDVILQKTNRRSIAALRNLVRLFEALQDDTLQEHKKRLLNEKILSYNEELYKLTRDPHLSYRIGNDAASLSQYQKALRFYRQAYDGMSPEDPYRPIALKRISRLPIYEHDEQSTDSK
jgi:tetratricopeptide (TPR) repeat protein